MAAPDRFNAMGGLSSGGGGPGTPNRHPSLPPSVIISPSAPVCCVTQFVSYSLIS
jgi:serine/threonine-protein phosphatase 2A regulatory subunit B'